MFLLDIMDGSVEQLFLKALFEFTFDYNFGDMRVNRFDFGQIFSR